MTESRRLLDIDPELVDPLSLQEAATTLGVHERTVRRAIARGDLVARKQGRSIAVTRASLDEFVRRRRPVETEGAWTRSRPLPKPLTTFIGRDQLIASLSALLVNGPDRLLTLVGPGGVGKTRLSLQVLQRVAPAFAEAAAFVALAAVEEPNLVMPAIVQALDLPPNQSLTPIEQLQRFLGGTRFLLVLDNLEHVRDAGPALASLVVTCPGLVMLVTSRVRLLVAGERSFPVPPLSLPPAKDETAFESLAAIAQAEAVRLFVARAELVNPDFTLTSTNAGDIAAICRRLDGLPLALELAASRLRHFGLHDLRVRLERALPLLVGGPRDAPLRLQTMRDAIAWSYGLLGQEERTLFREISVFVGGFTIDAAMQIVQTGTHRVPEFSRAGEFLASDDALVERLSTLVDHSLVRLEPVHDPHHPNTRSRFTMFETIREFGFEQLAATDEKHRVREAHADWYVALARQGNAAMWSGDQALWFDRLEQEQPNFRAALSWLLAQRDGPRGLALVGGMIWFWTSRGYLYEAARWMEAFLALSPAAASSERARVLMEAANVAQWQGNDIAAVAYSQEALAYFREVGDRVGMAYALRQLGSMAIYRGDLDEAAANLAASEPVLLAEGIAWDAGFARYLAGRLAMARVEVAEAIQAFAEAAAAFCAIGNKEYFAASRCQQATAYVAQGQLIEARSAYGEGLDIAQEFNQPFWIAWSLAGAAELAFRESRQDLAARFYLAARRLVEETGLEAEDAVPAALGVKLGVPEFGAASPPSPVTDAQILADAMSFLQAPSGQQDTRVEQGDLVPGLLALTPRERQVLALLAKGLTDKEIASHLHIARLTAVNHVAAVRQKLGVPSRTAAAALAIQYQIVD